MDSVPAEILQKIVLHTSFSPATFLDLKLVSFKWYNALNDALLLNKFFRARYASYSPLHLTPQGSPPSEPERDETTPVRGAREQAIGYRNRASIDSLSTAAGTTISFWTTQSRRCGVRVESQTTNVYFGLSSINSYKKWGCWVAQTSGGLGTFYIELCVRVKAT